MKKVKYTKDEIEELLKIGRELRKCPTMFYTCHCTGETAYRILKITMGDQIRYVHSGDEVKIEKWNKDKERKQVFMKWHKFFAWATVFCFVMTMMTGYEKK
jgi:7,8-dihydropterin-6-yl-methyl-4-(beta-D-ribofuranosyl)aminobenzene 5'-phosphate synthase